MWRGFSAGQQLEKVVAAASCASKAGGRMQQQQQCVPVDAPPTADCVDPAAVLTFPLTGGCKRPYHMSSSSELHSDSSGIETVPDSVEVQAVKAKSCFCSNNTYGIDNMFMGMSDCTMYMMQFDVHEKVKPLKEYEVTFHIPGKKTKILSVINQTLPANVSIGNFKDIWGICGNNAFIFLPYGWTGCCYMATLKLPWEVSVVKHGEQQESSGGRVKREMAEFNNLESYHWRISLAEKWGIGLFPWYGVTFLADHIDNITYNSLQGFANETIRGF
ncbi:Protein L-Myc-1b [Merluccius polli]|uniref:Protein L-Myc-1b n=1 Tax=Merluccius polli TaxID=89951 RepID=A0AA47N6I3_MERPO|nr:Protein L-Myc-1b [Merluccius polli]